MALIYVFNENIVEVSGTAGQTVTTTIAGYTVKAVVQSDGKARINASPYYQMKFANINKNSNTTFTTIVALGANTLKYGYLDADETSDTKYVSQRQKYNASSSVCSKQTKIRFLDHYGNWCYWVMDNGSTSYTDASNGEMIQNVIGTYSISRPQIKSFVKSMNLCAPKVDETTFAFLSDIKRSINVCVQIGSAWIPVVVSSGASSWVVDTKKAKKQDFEITVTFPENSVSL